MIFLVYELLLLFDSLLLVKIKGKEVKVNPSLLVNDEHKDHKKKTNSFVSIFLKYMIISTIY